MPDQIQLPMQVRAASVLPKTVNEETRTAEVLFSTGAQVRRYSWQRGSDYLESLEISDKAIRFERLRDGAPVLDSHNSYSLDGVIGVVESAEVRKGKAFATIRFAAGDEGTDVVWRKVRDGIIRNVSVGYRIHEIEEREKDGQRFVDVVDWEPLEISLVPVGADAGAGVRAGGGDEYPCIIKRAETTSASEEDDLMSKAKDKATDNADSARDDGPGSADVAKRIADAEVIARKAGVEEGRSNALAIIELCGNSKTALRTAHDMMKRGISSDEARSELFARRDAAISSEDEIAGQNGANSPGDIQPGALSARMAARFNQSKGV